MSVVKQYRIIKDIPFQFLQMDLKEGMICIYYERADAYIVRLSDNKDHAISSRIVESWAEYFEPVMEDEKA